MTSKYLKNWVFFLFALLVFFQAFAKGPDPVGAIAVADLPREAQVTLELIKRDGPYPHAKDGAVFGNYERSLPQQRRGYYREFTVKTPGARNRGARRIVVGGESISRRQFYYTDDHYATFKRILK